MPAKDATSVSSQRADYGLDAPTVVFRFFALGVAGIVTGAICFYLSREGVASWARSFAFASVSIGISSLTSALVMTWGSKAGKLQLRDKVISSMNWRGDERVLDVGCGHGLMLIAAASRLTTGKAVGIDLWQQEDQAGNSREATLKNARCEGVAERVEIMDGDARRMPFLDGEFDVVVSSWALHNIYDSDGRASAVKEIARVLKPGGRVAVVDIRHTGEYAEIFKQCGLVDIQRSAPNFLFFIPTFTLTARKAL